MADKDRKAEIERRKKRLEELRQAREQKKKEVKDKEIINKSPESLAQERENVDELVAQILGPKGTPAPTSTSPTPTPITSDTGGGANVKTGPSLEESESASVPIPVVTTKRRVKLSIDSMLPINIRPKTIEQYEKHTQTELRGNEATSDQESDHEDNTALSSSPDKPVSKNSSKVGPEETMATDAVVPSLPPITTSMTDEEKQHILSSDDYSRFIERAGLVMERALSDTTDILFDLSGGKQEENEDARLTSVNVVQKKQLSDPRWTKGRIVSSIAWSPHHPGVIAASYYLQETVSMDPDGVILVWDLKFNKETPDYVFNCHSPVMSVCFSKFHPHYVIGGTYSGQIVVWDIRSGKRTPVQRSLLSASAHTHPVYCLELVGSQNAHNLISVSTNGKLCSWNLDNLSQPQESTELLNRHPRPVAVTSLSFPVNDVNKFIVGSEEGMVHQGQRHGKKPGLTVQYEGHFGTVTGVSCHRATHSQVDFSNLFLSSSIDWTVKLWNLKLINEQQVNTKIATPVCSFYGNSDFIYDVKWSPNHPALFASVDGAGHLEFWNINQDTEVPILTEVLDTALSKVQWSPNGQLLAVGDIEGTIHIYEAGEDLCIPQSDEWSKMQSTITELQSNMSQQEQS